MKDVLIVFLSIIGIIIVPMLITAMFELSFMLILGITLDVIVKSVIWFILQLFFGVMIAFCITDYFEKKYKQK